MSSILTLGKTFPNAIIKLKLLYFQFNFMEFFEKPMHLAYKCNCLIFHHGKIISFPVMDVGVMRRTLLKCWCRWLVFFPVIGWAYGTSSNHSYIKNSSIFNGATLGARGYGDARLVQMEGKGQFETDLSLDLSLTNTQQLTASYGIHVNPLLNTNFGTNLLYYVFWDNYWGKFELGNTTDVTENLRIGTDSLHNGWGAVGDLLRYATFPAGSGMLFESGTLLNKNFGFHENQLERKFWDYSKYMNRLNYYSPDIYGFQMGLSITPQVALTQQNFTQLRSDKTNLGNFAGVGISYIQTLENVGIGLSLIYETNQDNLLQKFKQIRQETQSMLMLESAEIGANVSFLGFTLAGVIGKNQKKVMNDNNIPGLTSISGHHLAYGGSYEFGSFSLGGTLFQSIFGLDKFLMQNAEIRQKISRNLSIYLRYTNFRFGNNNPKFIVSCGTAVDF
jgi:hypothetical protein